MISVFITDIIADKTKNTSPPITKRIIVQKLEQTKTERKATPRLAGLKPIRVIKPMAKSYRTSQAALMAQRRRLEIGVEIGPIKNLRRRRLCTEDPERFCRVYFPRICYNRFTDDQRTMITAITDRLKYGGFQSIAAPRGDGKSIITRLVSLWALFYGWLKFIVLIGANSDFARGHLRDLKSQMENNQLLRDDFPEVCDPIAALEGAPQRGGTQIAEGARTRLYWGQHEIHLPIVPGSTAAGGIIMALGIEAPIRGLVRSGRRPDLVICDDIETKASANSDADTTRLRDVLDNDILGLAGPDKQIAAVYLCTILKESCISDVLTNPQESPAWHGIRQRFLIEKPADEATWQEYIELRQADQLAGDPTARRAHKFYWQNRRRMNLGAKINNPYRYDHTKLPDGSRIELSALQHAYNLIADRGWENFAAEYQNDPKSDPNIEATDITIKSICAKLNHLDRGAVPIWSERITAGLDIGGRQIHWVVIAWRNPMLGAIIDYGIEPVYSPAGKVTAEENLNETRAAILAALAGFNEWADQGWPRIDTGEIINLDLALIDAGWQPDPVYKFCQAHPKYRPSKGLGTGSLTARYRPAGKKTGPAYSGRHWHAVRRSPRDPYLYHLDSDFWKNTVHGGLILPANTPGSLVLFGSEALTHRPFALQITAETWTREFTPGRGWRERFAVHSRHNHWLDATAAGVAAADMLGIQPISEPARQKKKLSEIQAAKRGARR